MSFPITMIPIVVGTARPDGLLPTFLCTFATATPTNTKYSWRHPVQHVPMTLHHSYLSQYRTQRKKFSVSNIGGLRYVEFGHPQLPSMAKSGRAWFIMQPAKTVQTPQLHETVKELGDLHMYIF